MKLKNAFLALCLLIPVLAFSANEGGGGGNSLAAEFADTAVKALEHALNSSPEIKINGRVIQLKSMLEMARHMKVTVSTKPLKLAEREVQAINWPSKKEITFYGSAWKKLNLAEKKRLTVHEVLGLSRVDDSSFQVSRLIVELEDPCRTDGCTMLRDEQFRAAYNYVQDEDGCYEFLKGIERLGERRFKVTCGTDTDLEVMILETVPKHEGYDNGEYNVIKIQENKK